MLQYVITVKETLRIKIEEMGSPRRVLYWDTLCKQAKEEDKDVLVLFRKIKAKFSRDIESISFSEIDVPIAEIHAVMGALAKTKRTSLQIDWENPARLKWKAKGDLFWQVIVYLGNEIELKSCEKVFPTWAIWQKIAFPFTSVLKRDRPRLDEVEVEWIQENPRLILTDGTGCFANLETVEWEKDLLEVGFVRKTVGNSNYFCPSDNVYNALELLLQVGWDIFLFGKKLYPQTKDEWEIGEVNQEISIRGKIHFKEKEIPFEACQKSRMWVELDSSTIGLIDRKKIKLIDGEGTKEAAQLIPFLDVENVKWKDSLFELVLGLKTREIKQINLDSNFHGELLAHQQKGLNWLMFLYVNGFSGLLADEMGLGKTVQVLAFFSCLRTNLPVLIVAPASLLYNWQSEIKRFLPEATVDVYLGGEIRTQFIIVSYARLRLGIPDMEWEAVVLDESNAIKTRTTQTAQAACQLKSRFRICLSGTPIENRIEELHAQFHFLMPGVKELKPFILRRKKDELDLPEKFEQISFIDMEEEQRVLYDSYLQKVQSGLPELDRMGILEAILRLRQIATDPRLLGEKSQGAKIERLLVDLEEAMAERRKVLIYSQFTSMLKLVEQELKWPYLYLDGSVAAKDRAERVKEFQENPNISLFLLSLKAGGVGLNLTAADYVLILDPWWNDAVENQAIDRAHRIGQTKAVIAKRYITAHSIEEKMLQLKKEKSEASQRVLDQGDEFSFTEEDLLHLLT